MERIKVAQLEKRFNIARSALWSRMSRLGIHPQRDGKWSYISAEDLEILQQLHEFLDQGGTIREFATDRQIAQPKSDVSLIDLYQRIIELEQRLEQLEKK